MPNLNLLGLAAVAAAGGFLAHAVRGRAATFFGPSIYHGDRGRRSLALTFDDGPSESTTELLAILSKHNAKATFFMCGKNVERLPDIARAVADAGHEIGNHSDTHPRFDFCSATFIDRELSLAQEKIAHATGITPNLFRAPYGVRWFGMRQAQARLGLTGVMWTTIARDWRWPADRVAQRIEASPRGGDIICLHDGRETQVAPDIWATLQAVEQVLPRLANRGFGFETVSALCRTK
jgi:peptidoglycan-N-acetylglucosamine deacetylase